MCDGCGSEVKAKEKQVDHIDPFTPLTGFKSLEDWGPALVRMFDLNNHQILCETCHQIKTEQENLERKKLRSGTK
jgi:5-methylcytosine-specific restriction endonuclease McrA